MRYFVRYHSSIRSFFWRLILHKLTSVFLILTLMILASCGSDRGENIEEMDIKVSISDENKIPVKGVIGWFCLRLRFEGQAEEDADEECGDAPQRTDNSGIFTIKLTSRFAQKMRRRYANRDLLVEQAELFFRVNGARFEDGATREFVGDIVDSNLSGNAGRVHGWADIDIYMPRELADDYFRN